MYKGRILRFGKWIDIIARRFDRDSWRGLVEFKWEITMLCSLKHPNLATIVGFCDESDEKIIVYKFEDNGSLEQYLDDPTSLPWRLRLQICLGIARALRYIHYDEGRDFSVIHRNIKSSKILLDECGEAKLYGFELSVIQPAYRRQRIVLDRLISGTYAYVDPAYLKDEGVTHKSDLYSLGVVFFEVLCGRKAFQMLPGSPVPSYSDVKRHSNPTITEQNIPSGHRASFSSIERELNPASSYIRYLPADSMEGRVFKPTAWNQVAALKWKIQPSVAQQSEIARWQPETKATFKDLRNLVLSWKRLSAESFGPKTKRVEYSYDMYEKYMSTMKSLPSLNPEQKGLLAILAKPHYEDGTLDDIIHPGLRSQMDSESLKIFSHAAYCCLNHQRAQRPNIDRVISVLEQALQLQLQYEKSLVIKVDSTVAAQVSSSKLLKFRRTTADRRRRTIADHRRRTTADRRPLFSLRVTLHQPRTPGNRHHLDNNVNRLNLLYGRLET